MGHTAFKPIKRASLAETIAAQLREAIVTGQFAPGDALAEPTLAENLGVSRAPIREALIALEREGIVQFDDRGRTRVRRLEAADFDEICTLRIALEGLAGRLACRRWDQALAASIEASIERQLRAKTVGELSRLDVDLHEIIVRAAGHERLIAAWLVLRPQLEMWLTHTFALQTKLHHEPRDGTVQSHRNLIQALASGDEARAASAAGTHIELWRDWQPASFPAR